MQPSFPTSGISSCSKKLIHDEYGFVISAELMLIITLMFCAATVGWGAVKDSLANELNDVSHAIGAVS